MSCGMIMSKQTVFHIYFISIQVIKIRIEFGRVMMMKMKKKLLIMLCRPLDLFTNFWRESGFKMYEGVMIYTLSGL